ncbi:AAA family ATPase [Achromobacter sp. LC458]|uniref:RNA-binding domain-containing protein n=1 Tax=Achromobacter sp. LC458 TaxID=1120623 RepID=UPI000629EBC9|nr:RNA-binding domain-containing protein [Achromobacter sp. LC458]TRM51896.1 AAA family ATPase [Achromobacter sp. LC458]
MASTLYSQNFDLADLTETTDVECKLAHGKDGAGQLPKSFWESYSAMANTHGGDILLGVEERGGHLVAVGVPNAEKVKQDLWNGAHNPTQISANVLGVDDVRIVPTGKMEILVVSVRQARREERPVHVGLNPMTGTYLRRNEGDYRATEEQVRRMMAERVEDARDARVLEHYDIADLDLESVTSYRNRFSAVRPGHVYLDMGMSEFLQKIGAYGTDRASGKSGLTLAGLLMFGQSETIREVLPNYMVDYQERPEAKAEKRWVDRLIPDGSWSGNVYDFFRRTYQKLTDGSKVPFRLVDGQRVEDSAQTEALREALVNTLIHADFTGRVSVLVVKRPDMYGFRNPGRMRIPLDLALMGGNSDCRNRRLQTMFQLVGYGDHAGSGIPKIYSNWQSQQWRRPSLYELDEPEQTLMELRMESMFPEEAIEELKERFSERFTGLPELERLVLVSAAAEGTINHARVKELCADHPVDITRALTSLVRAGMLESDGVRRGMIYFLPGYKKDNSEPFASPATVLPPPVEAAPVVDSSSGHSDPSSGHSESLSGHKSVVQDTTLGLKERLQELLGPGPLPARMPPDRMEELIVSLCDEQFVTLRDLAQALSRSDASLRKHYLNPLVDAGRLVRKYPAPSHPQQAYKRYSATTTKPID